MPSRPSRRKTSAAPPSASTSASASAQLSTSTSLPSTIVSTPNRSHSQSTTHPAAHLLSLAGHPHDAASTLFTTHIRQKPLLLRPTSPPPAAKPASNKLTASTTGKNDTSTDARTRRRLARDSRPSRAHFLAHQKPRPLSAKEKRMLGLYDLTSKDDCRYATYEGLHRLWVGYMQEVLGMKQLLERHQEGGVTEGRPSVSVDAAGQMIASADFHGAMVTVVRAKDVDRVGCQGIVVRDTRYTFVVVCPGDKVRTIPKRNTVFRVEVPWPSPTASSPSSSSAPDALTTVDSQIATTPPTSTSSQPTHPPPQNPPPQQHNNGEPESVEEKAEEPESQRQWQRQRQRPPPPLTFDLHGSGFEMRAAERAKRGFKWKVMPYL